MTSKRYPDKGFNGVDLIVGQISSSVTAEIRSMIAFISNKNNIIDAVQALIILNKQRHLLFWNTISPKVKKQKLVLYRPIGTRNVKLNGSNITFFSLFILIHSKQLTCAPNSQDTFPSNLSR